MYTYPDVTEAFFVEIDEAEFAGQPCKAYKRLTVDFADTVPEVAAVQVSNLGGPPAIFDRVVRIGIDVYAEGELADRIGEAIATEFVGVNRSVEDVGQLDTIDVETLPHPVPYASDRINVSSAVYRVTVRPV